MSNRLPVGPGSRGGSGTSAAYYRVWRRNNPAYRAREQARMVRRRQLRADARPMPSLTDAILAVVREECRRTSQRQVGERLAMSNSSVSRWLAPDGPGGRIMQSEAIDAVVAVYGFDRIVTTMRRLRGNARRGGGVSDRAGRLTPGLLDPSAAPAVAA